MTIFGLFWVPGRGQKMDFSKNRQKSLKYIQGDPVCRPISTDISIFFRISIDSRFPTFSELRAPVGG